MSFLTFITYFMIADVVTSAVGGVVLYFAFPMIKVRVRGYVASLIQEELVQGQDVSDGGCACGDPDCDIKCDSDDEQCMCCGCDNDDGNGGCNVDNCTKE